MCLVMSNVFGSHVSGIVGCLVICLVFGNAQCWVLRVYVHNPRAHLTMQPTFEKVGCLVIGSAEPFV